MVYDAFGVKRRRTLHAHVEPSWVADVACRRAVQDFMSTRGLSSDRRINPVVLGRCYESSKYHYNDFGMSDKR
jgi:hypothetical protein